MTRSKTFRAVSFHIAAGIIAITIATIGLVVAPQLAFAQHGGGGGHAGGGGGGHFSGGGGGGHFGGGGSHASAPAPAHVTNPPHNSAPTYSVQPHTNTSPTPANGSHAGFAPFGATNGAGHVAGNATTPPSATPHFAPPTHEVLGFPADSENSVHWTQQPPSTTRPGAPLSFTGQGHDIWQSSPATGSAGSPRFRVTPPVRIFPVPPRGRPYYPIFYGPAWGFFGPEFGFGLGLNCDPYWNWDFGCNGFGYDGFGYNGYGYYGGSSAPYYLQGGPDDSSDSQDVAPSLWRNGPGPSDDSSDVQENVQGNVQGNADSSGPDTVIYLKDGTSFAVKDYWVADGQLYYVTTYGGENSINLNLFDVQRSTDDNAARGVTLTLRPTPAQPDTQQPQQQQAPPPQTPSAPQSQQPPQQ